MLYTFQSKSSSPVLMLGPLAHEVLRAMGREPLPQGIVEPLDLQSALRQLDAAVAAAAQPAQAESELAQSAEAIGLKQRAWPVQDMLRLAMEYGNVVTWSAQ
jgi:uncharacterized protein with von Willebrand factor type A (vWA) domain